MTRDSLNRCPKCNYEYSGIHEIDGKVCQLGQDFRGDSPASKDNAETAVAAIGESVAQAGSIPASPATDTLIDCRAAFEKWCESESYDYFTKDEQGRYMYAEAAWQAFQTAWNHQQREMLYTADRDEPLIDAVIAGAATWLVENKKQAIPRDIAYEIVRSLRPWLRYPARESSELYKRYTGALKTIRSLDDWDDISLAKRVAQQALSEIEGGKP